mgnify:CR=1 FL=1
MGKNKTIKRLSAVLFAVLLIAALVLSVLTKGFTDWQFGKEQPTVNDLNSNVVVTPQEGNGGIRLMAEFLPEITQGDNETDYESETLTITATVSPDNSADNTGLDWSMAFKNPSSAWATGKTLSDYMTLTPSGTDAAGSKKVSVKCLKPFGEQIVITATSQDNPEVKATCTADFAQRIESATLKFGDLNVNLGGDTNVKWELNPNGVGVGGATSVTMEKSDVYTLAEDFTYTVTLTSNNGFFQLDGKTITFTDPGDVTSGGITFDYAQFDTLHMMIIDRIDDFCFYEASVSELIPYFSEITDGYLFDVALTFTGEHTEQVFSSVLKVNGYTNSSVISDVTFDNSGLVF